MNKVEGIKDLIEKETHIINLVTRGPDLYVKAEVLLFNLADLLDKVRDLYGADVKQDYEHKCFKIDKCGFNENIHVGLNIQAE